jgi:hypothetical protein
MSYIVSVCSLFSPQTSATLIFFPHNNSNTIFVNLTVENTYKIMFHVIFNKQIFPGNKKMGNKSKGWSVEGMTRFNELTTTVAKDHKKPYTAVVEEQLKELWARAESEGKIKWKKRKQLQVSRMECVQWLWVEIN